MVWGRAGRAGGASAAITRIAPDITLIENATLKSFAFMESVSLSFRVG